ncbi:hypothetical protein [Chryseobacterium taihuense]|uniref:Uncharacterized protein n=1 Tax=Chryseobacterium taihuense TaxID=1141221 RepID=A0ABY0R1F1_9FLAO|nr:hypothetical protein [Chryseobacterium taihuense]SDM26331.1 hypothetical protein SAMN05216273_11913 [Chryseobacterium taihuense]
MKKTFLILSLVYFGFFSAQKSENYLEISYNSICCGTSSTDPVINYISVFQKKNKTKPFEIFRQPGLGREGEFKLFVGTDQLSPKIKAKFTSGLQNIINSQNKADSKTSKGKIDFNSSETVKKATLLNIDNLILYKKEQSK